MNQYRQTAADLHNLRSPEVEPKWERFAGIALAFFIATGIAATLVHWWSA